MTGLRNTARRAAKLHQLARLKRQALEITGTDDKHLGDRAALASRFNTAREAIWLAFQPIVSWSQRTIVGYEALLRSDEATLGSPAQLIDAAERLGCIHELGRTVRNKVAENAAGAPEAVSFFVNLHPG